MANGKLVATINVGSLLADMSDGLVAASYTTAGFVKKLDGMNLKEVSIKSGIPYATVHGISKGSINPRMITAVKLTNYLGSL